MSQDLDTTYFTCTLGQAKIVNRDCQPITNINALVDKKATQHPDNYVVGFANLDNSQNPSTRSKSQKYTFKQVQRGIIHVSKLLTKSLNQENSPNSDMKEPSTVALLCPSTPEFLFTWLSLIRLGYAVLLIAPQCQASAVAHLCKITNVDTLFHDSTYEELAQNSGIAAKQEKEHDLATVLLPFSTTSDNFLQALTTDTPIPDYPQLSETAAAYLHHTSGTSTGLPKPITQSHRAGVGVLPHSLDGSKHATFTTTPLYHGGVADLFRAWTSNAMIWLFPGRGVPITAKNIISCLEIAEGETKAGVPSVRYFSSVPYVLQMMAGDPRGLEYLTDMDIVGVGGAALPAEVGDELVKKGVNLVSRFGSAEVGFLMSSHRDYEKDREWQYLRSGAGAEDLRFEERECGLCELVVMKGWPHVAKTNKENGSFASADLFLPHSCLPNAWKYHSRSDSQLTLITGKKFDPAPLEDSIATSPLLTDVLIFGNGRPFPGALLFRSEAAAELSDEGLVEKIAPAVEQLNGKSADHARLARNLLVPVGFGENRLEKSSKGTLLRNKAEETYKDMIEHAYTALAGGVNSDISDSDVAEVIRDKIEKMVGRNSGTAKGKDGAEPLGLDTELFSYGVDSVASIQIRYTLAQLLPQGSGELPLSVVEDCGSVGKLAEFVLRRRRGQEDVDENDGDEMGLMRELVEEYGDFSEFTEAKDKPSDALTNGHNAEQDTNGENKDKKTGEVVILTGATGALGAHLLNAYRNDPSVTHIYCLVRGADDHAARERVHKSLLQRGLPGLDSSSSSTTITTSSSSSVSTNTDKTDNTIKNSSTGPTITVLPARLHLPTLGLSDSTYAHLAATATIIAHLAWAVNFRQRLRSFVRDHIAGVRHLLLLALAAPKGKTPPMLAFCSSIASVSSWDAGHSNGREGGIGIPEIVSKSPETASPLGYSRSKWVAEGVLAKAYEQVPRLREGGLAILRVGQLSGDSVKGVWNAKEAWPLMLGSVRATDALPQLGREEKLSWLPVDVAAMGWVEVVGEMRDGRRRGGGDGTRGEGKDGEVPVFHVLNPSLTPTWQVLLEWLKGCGVSFEAVSPAEWVRRLEKLQKERSDHPALQLLGMWREAYGKKEDGHGAGEPAKNDSKDEGEVFDTSRAKKASEALAAVGPLDKEYIARVWKWIEANVEKW